jgi:hypothetical protein
MMASQETGPEVEGFAYSRGDGACGWFDVSLYCRARIARLFLLGIFSKYWEAES